MLDAANVCIMQIERETTNPVDSKLFQVLVNVFVALDILSVAVTGDNNMYFAHANRVDLRNVGCSPQFMAAFASLQNRTIRAVLPTYNNTVTNISPWLMWAVFKHRTIGDVTIDSSGPLPMIVLGEVRLTFDHLKSYVGEARKLVVLAQV